MFDEFGKWLLDYRIEFSCLYISQEHYFIRTLLLQMYRWIYFFLYFERKSTFRNSMALGQWSNSCQAELLRSTLYVLQSFWFNTNALISLYAMYDIRDYGKEIVCDVLTIQLTTALTGRTRNCSIVRVSMNCCETRFNDTQTYLHKGGVVYTVLSEDSTYQ